MKKQLFSTALALGLALGLSTPTLAAGSTFTDVPENHWAYPYVSQAVEEGWITGYGNGTFGVDDKVTYDQFFTMVVQAFLPDALASYTGPTTPWSQPYVTTAYEHGILTPVTNINAMAWGEWGNFYENSQPVNRAEMACILSKTLFALDVQVDYDKNAVAASIPDHDDIYQGYEEYILTCVGSGIISGVDDQGTFNGWGLMTRGQAAVVLCNASQVIEQGGIPSNPTQPTDPEEPVEPTEPEAPTLANGAEITEENVRALIESLKSEYPQGMPWTNDNFYRSDALHAGGYGCEGFALICSDTAFGDLPISKRHSNFDEIRAGDMIRMNNDTHTFVVLQKKENSVIVTEGNMNSSIYWGREISRQSLENGNFQVRTRYPA